MLIINIKYYLYIINFYRDFNDLSENLFIISEN